MPNKTGGLFNGGSTLISNSNEVFEVNRFRFPKISTVYFPAYRPLEVCQVTTRVNGLNVINPVS